MVIAASAFSGWSVYAQNAPSYCAISDVHVSSITPTDYSSTTVQVISSFSVSCAGAPEGTVWNIETKVYSESNLVGVALLSSSENQYSYGQGNAQYVVNNHFNAMNYYGYGEQTPAFYVQITAINTSTGSLDAQEQVPFAVDTSQYPFDLTQQNYCQFPGLSQFFQLLPGCGGSTNNTSNPGTTSSNCNTYGLPQFLQPYPPGCSGTTNPPTVSNESSTQQIVVQEPGNSLSQPNTSPALTSNVLSNSGRSIEVVSAIIVTALGTLLAAVLVNLTRFRTFFHARLRASRKFCTTCGLRLESSANFCDRCGEPCQYEKDLVTFHI